jgi:hypothetical protein
MPEKKEVVPFCICRLKNFEPLIVIPESNGGM